MVSSSDSGGSACWTRRAGRATDPTYNSHTCFETFPFPDGLTPNLPATSYTDNPYAKAIAAAACELVEKRDLRLNPPELVERVPEVVPGFPDRIAPRNAKAAATLKTRTLTNLYNTRGTPEVPGWTTCITRSIRQSPPPMAGRPTFPTTRY
jgi:hypothetical protein